ncbi:hypothetical protein ZEAMMB73_Zm00001d053187 [Zea mays]|uniref:Uncharacterized protein n=1 Tax=Zea mays TaxID=4577 RepID=A0A1D6QMM0_MAIZE|nr:hypothetical protein ZEAMMB73_Zm00001d053187 [Zea mays]
MGSILTEIDTKTSIKDLTISSNEKFLAVNRSSGPCIDWITADALADGKQSTGEPETCFVS